MPPLAHVDTATASLIRLSAAIAAGDDTSIRRAFADTARDGVPSAWTEEVVLQSYLFCGFPRALNAAREWRRRTPAPPATAAGDDATDYARGDAWRARGEAACAAVYGPMYEKLRDNVSALHPALDEWMIVEGYGKLLGRPGLDLGRRELCVVAACAATAQHRQLHSHLHGSLNVGVSLVALGEAIDVLEPLIGAETARSVRLLLARVAGK